MIIIDVGRRPRRHGRRTTPPSIGHRGASGYRPEHTLASYELAILQCADFIEPDLVSTKDGVLVARHENEIGGTTDVAAHPEFADRQTTKTIDGVAITGWFTEDFTLAELQHAAGPRAASPASGRRTPRSTAATEIPTFDEVVDLARHSRTCDGRPVGVYPETKHPTYFDSHRPVAGGGARATSCTANGYRGRERPVFIQSFETGNLRQLDRMTNAAAGPADQLHRRAVRPRRRRRPPHVRRPGHPTRARPRSPRYADGVGLCKDVHDPARRRRQPDDAAPTSSATPTAEGLVVHGWTFRRENQFLPAAFRSSADPNAVGDLAGEIGVVPRRRDGRLLHRQPGPRRRRRRLTDAARLAPMASAVSRRG